MERKLEIPLKVIPARLVTGGYVATSASWPRNQPPYLLGPTSDKQAELKLVTGSVNTAGMQILTLQGGVKLEPVDEDTEILWTAHENLRFAPYRLKIKEHT